MSTSLLHGTGHAENPWQMLIIARASSFVLLVRLSKRRVLHLEVDEVRHNRIGYFSHSDVVDESGQRFITGKLEVIRTEMMLHMEHVPRLVRCRAVDWVRCG